MFPSYEYESMVMHPAEKAMLTDTITVAAATGYDAFGVATYGTPMSLPARIQKRMKLMAGPSGPQLVAETKVVVDGDLPILETDQVTLPDASQPPIKGLETYKDEMGLLHHYTIVF